MAERRRGRPTAVGEALHSYLAKSGLVKRVAQAQVIPDWPRLVGAPIAAGTPPESPPPDGTPVARGARGRWMTEPHLQAPPSKAAGEHGPGRATTQPVPWPLTPH